MKTANMAKSNCPVESAPAQVQSDETDSWAQYGDYYGWETQYNRIIWHVGCLPEEVPEEAQTSKMFVVRQGAAAPERHMAKPPGSIKIECEAYDVFASEYGKIDAPSEPRFRTLDCPSIFRFEKTSSKLCTWTEREAEHIVVCRYCRRIRDVFESKERHVPSATLMKFGT